MKTLWKKLPVWLKGIIGTVLVSIVFFFLFVVGARQCIGIPNACGGNIFFQAGNVYFTIALFPLEVVSYFFPGVMKQSDALSIIIFLLDLAVFGSLVGVLSDFILKKWKRNRR